MRLNKFSVHNYKQHVDREQKLEGNLIGIIGPNGSGKSNLLGALQFALSGEQPGFIKADLLKWGSAEGHVEVEFEHNNKSGKIKRDLHGNGATFSYEGAETVRGISKVNLALDEIMGIDRDLIKQVVFVRQAEIDAILFTDPKIRELSFQRLCGIGDAAKIHKRLGELIAQMGAPVNYDSGIAEGEVRLGQLQARVKELNVQAQALAEKRNTFNVEQLKAELQRLTQFKHVLEQLPGVDHHIKECELNDMNLRAQLGKVKAATPQVDMAEIDRSIGQCYDLIRMIDSREMTARNYAEAEANYKALGSKPEFAPCPYTEEQVAVLKQKNDDIRRSYHEVVGTLKFYESLAMSLAGKLAEGMECPVCGNTLKDAHHLDARIAELKPRLEVLKNDNVQRQYEDADSARRSYLRTVEQQQATYSTKSAVLSMEVERWNKQLTSLPAVPYTKDEVQKRILEFSAVRETFVKMNNELTRLTTALSTNQWDWDKTLKLRDGLKADLLAVTGTDTVLDYTGTLAGIGDKYAQCTVAIDTATALNRDLAGLMGMLQECETGMATVAASLKSLRAKRDAQAEAQDKMKVLNGVRDWFHYNNGPHTMASTVLADMTKDVNTFLGHFGAPYSVINSDEGVGFKYIYNTSKDIPTGQYPDAYHLSGGEKIQLAVSFRFAAYMMFASKLGLLSLDEPSTYLDDKNIGNFCTLLEAVRSLAKKMELQILISTHERAILPFMDSIIDLATV